MPGDYTDLPLRPDQGWTGARLAQAGVLEDADWNLNMAAAQQRTRDAARDLLGPAALPRDSGAFAVTIVASGDLVIGPGRLWVGGLEAYAPSAFSYSSQPGVPPLPPGGWVLVYLDVFAEEVQAAEDPAVGEPALGGIDAGTRSRVGYRVRAVGTGAPDWQQAWAALDRRPHSGAAFEVLPPGGGAADPCAAAGAPAMIPDGLLRVEVLDSGSLNPQAGDQLPRLAWSYDNGSPAVPLLAAGPLGAVTPAPSPAVRFSQGDLVELSPPWRRADRADHGPLYRVARVQTSGGRDALFLVSDADGGQATVPPAVAQLAGRSRADLAGMVLRRWDGEAQRGGAALFGNASGITATRGGGTAGVRFDFRGEGADLIAGDWWAVRVRSGVALDGDVASSGVPDGVTHSFVPLAIVNLDEGGVGDLRSSYPAIAGFTPDAVIETTACTVTARPGDNLQDALALVPASGGELRIAAGRYLLSAPLRAVRRHRLVISGSGPATILFGETLDGAVLLQQCRDVALRNLDLASGLQGPPQTERPPTRGLATIAGGSAVTFEGCGFLTLNHPGDSPLQPCIVGGPDPAGAPLGRVGIVGCQLDPGVGQNGIRLDGVGVSALVSDNVIGHPGGLAEQAVHVSGNGCAIRILDNVIDGVADGISVGRGDGNDVTVSGNVVRIVIPPGYPGDPADHRAVRVVGARSTTVRDTLATKDVAAGSAPVTAVEVDDPGPFMVVHNTDARPYTYGVQVRRPSIDWFWLFAKSVDQRIFMNRAPSGTWAGWTEVPMQGITNVAVSAEVFQDQLYLFAKGRDDGLVYSASTFDGESWTAWTEVTPRGITDTAVAAARHSDVNGEALYLLSRGIVDRGVYAKSFDGSQWTGWSAIPDMTTLTAVASPSGSAISAFVRGENGLVYASALGTTVVPRVWGAWLALPLATDTAPAVATYDNTYVFGVKGRSIQMIKRVANPAGTAGSGWSAPVTVDGLDTDMAVATLVSDRIYLLATGLDGAVHMNAYDPPTGRWSGWSAIPGDLRTDAAPTGRYFRPAAQRIVTPTLRVVTGTMAASQGFYADPVLGVVEDDQLTNLPRPPR